MRPECLTDAVDAIPDVLPGEPANPRASRIGLWARVVLWVPGVVVLWAVMLPSWAIYAAMAAIWGRAPVMVRAAQVGRYLRAAWTEHPPGPGMPVGCRAWMTLTILRKVATAPLWGIAWLIDEALYGRGLDAIRVRAPLFEISAGRSGSTQLARYIEDDPRFVAPALIQCMFPFRWLWRLARATVGRRVTADQLRAFVERTLPPAFVERHEVDPCRTDTFEGAFLFAHLNHTALSFGPAFARREILVCRVSDHDRALWEQDFPDFLERIGRKILLDAGDDRTLFVKGHFLAAAPALARRFPDARFLAMIRSPDRRLQSGINFLRVNPPDPVLGAPPWPWLVEAVTRTELDYCATEQAWFTAPVGPARLVLRFDRYARDLPGTLRHVYADLLDLPPPPDLPADHPPRRRHGYLVDRSLPQLGIDPDRLLHSLSAYITWCSGG